MDPILSQFSKFPGNTAASLSTTLSEPLEKSVPQTPGALGPGRLWAGWAYHIRKPVGMVGLSGIGN